MAAEGKVGALIQTAEEELETESDGEEGDNKRLGEDVREGEVRNWVKWPGLYNRGRAHIMV